MYAACVASAGARYTTETQLLRAHQSHFVQIILELSKSNEKLEVAHLYLSP